MQEGHRRLEEPLGKADRSIALSFIGTAIATSGELPESAWIIVPALSLDLAVTIWNRLRFALSERKTAA
jgi:CDP-diacylglycerol--glycerol-3-phosphate 3-phosphatidyltransferase